MEENKKETTVVKNMLLYGLGGAMSQAAGLITLPLMTRVLSSHEYGAIEVITAATGYFSLLIGLNTMSGLYRFFYAADEKKHDRKSLVSTTFLFVFLTGLIIALMSIFLSPVFARNLFNDLSYSGIIRLAFSALIPVSIYTYSLCLLRIQNKAVVYIITAMIVSVVYMGCVILFIAVLHSGIAGYYYSQIIANMIGACIALFLSRQYLALQFSSYWFKKLAKYSFPLVPGTLFGWSLSANNRIFLNASTSQVEVAYYGLANKATVIITLATQAFCNAWEPTMYSLLDKTEKIRKTLPSMLSLYTFGALAICTAIMTIARELFLFLAPPEYLAGIGLLSIMQLRWIFTMGVYVIDPGTAKSGRTYWVSIMLGIAVLVNLGSNLLLTSKFGLYGAVISELLGYVVAMSGRWFISNRFFPIQWHYRYFLSLLVCYGITAWLQTRIIFGNYPWVWSFLLRLLLTLIFLVFAWFTLDRESKNIITSSIQPLKKRMIR